MLAVFGNRCKDNEFLPIDQTFYRKTALFLYLTSDNASAVCADIDATIFLHVADDVQDKAILVLVIVDTNPGLCCIIGAIEAILTVDDTDEVESRIVRCQTLAKAETIDGADLREGFTEVRSVEG